MLRCNVITLTHNCGSKGDSLIAVFTMSAQMEYAARLESLPQSLKHSQVHGYDQAPQLRVPTVEGVVRACVRQMVNEDPSSRH